MIYIARPTELTNIPESCWACMFSRRRLVVEVQCIQTGEWMDGKQTLSGLCAKRVMQSNKKLQYHENHDILYIEVEERGKQK